MAELNINISGSIPDNDYYTRLFRSVDDSSQFSGVLTYTGGEASATLSTAIEGDIITGYMIDNLYPSVNGAVIEGVAVGGDDKIFNTWSDSFNVWLGE